MQNNYICDPKGGAVNLLTRRPDSTSSLPALACPRWYAIQTRSGQEKAVAKQFQIWGAGSFLTLVTEIYRRSDRRKVVEHPLFSSYGFVQLITTGESRASLPHT